MKTLAIVAALTIGCLAASAKEAAEQTPGHNGTTQPIGGGKPVTTTIIRRCPAGYELVVRAGGRPGCARDIVPPND